jgi:hypothetical protein
MNLTIRRDHTVGTRFDHQQTGPLVKAAAQQLPDLSIIKEFEGFCVGADGKIYTFDDTNNGYNRLTCAALADKEIKQINIQLIPGKE